MNRHIVSRHTRKTPKRENLERLPDLDPEERLEGHAYARSIVGVGTEINVCIRRSVVGFGFL